MPHLVAIDLPGGAAFVDALRRIWDNGDAAFPLDRRLPPAARQAVLATVRPDRVIDERGLHSVEVSADPDCNGIEEGDALVVATSGTTGLPKGVVLTHDAVTASAVATSARLGVGADDVWLACLPLSHVGGLSVITRAITTGTGLVVHDGFDASAVEQAAREDATLVSLVATAMRRIDTDLFRKIVLGGSRPPEDLPGNVVTTYGMTETGSGVVYDGKPLDGVEIDIDEHGEIHLRCPMLFRSYRDGSCPLVDGWFATGDLGEFAADGRLVVLGRRGDVINTGGEKVWPAHVEAVIAADPSVAGVAVAGVDDEEWGQRVVAWIVPAESSSLPTLDSIRSYVAASLPMYMAPREIRLVDALPTTSSGKVLRRELPN
ncbi:MAG TPA: AMP-binding protein [Ilumatobacteraceae bacterium]|nr:AMP-binding protein [Ilumatobacteraceae bacterium]